MPRPNKRTLDVYGIETFAAYTMHVGSRQGILSREDCGQLYLLHVCLCFWAESCSSQSGSRQWLSKTMVLLPYYFCPLQDPLTRIFAPEPHMVLPEPLPGLYYGFNFPCLILIPLFSFHRSDSLINSLLGFSCHFPEEPSDTRFSVPMQAGPQQRIPTLSFSWSSISSIQTFPLNWSPTVPFFSVVEL